MIWVELRSEQEKKKKKKRRLFRKITEEREREREERKDGAIAFDRLIEPGTAKSMSPRRIYADSKLERRNTTPNPKPDKGTHASNSKLERRGSVPPNVRLESGVNIPSIPKHDRRNSTSTSTTSLVERKHQWTDISPALYATPESTPLPDSPSSFLPSPYVINHKRRGPRLKKSFSDDDVGTCKQPTDEIKVDENGNVAEKELVSVDKDDNFIPKEIVDSTMDDGFISTDVGHAKENYLNGCDGEHGSRVITNDSAGQNGVVKSVTFDLQQDDEFDDFVDPQDSISVMSIGESEGNAGLERSLNSTTPLAEFYDAWEELSSESGPQLPMPDIENEVRGIRLSLLMEIDKRKQAEESLNIMREQWQRIREQLSLVGLTLPVDPTTLPEGDQPIDPAAEVCQQVFLARFVSNSIGRGIAKAEVEMEMEAQLKLKNVEIARLWDRLRYYEAVNQEMSQRNQEVVETARRLRQQKKRRQRWVMGSIATLSILGSAAEQVDTIDTFVKITKQNINGLKTNSSLKPQTQNCPYWRQNVVVRSMNELALQCNIISLPPRVKIHHTQKNPHFQLNRRKLINCNYSTSSTEIPTSSNTTRYPEEDGAHLQSSIHYSDFMTSKDVFLNDGEVDINDDGDYDDGSSMLLSLSVKPDRNMNLLDDYEMEEMEFVDPNHRSGYIAVVGLPNVGKSTLSNQMIGQKLSIVTDKPQTTRHRILGICSAPEYQMILYDTPGVIEKKMHKLDSMMMKNVRSATINADCVVVVVDACRAPQKIDEMLGEEVGDLKDKLPTLLVLNKKDLIKPGEIAKKIEYLILRPVCVVDYPNINPKGCLDDARFESQQPCMQYSIVTSLWYTWYEKFTDVDEVIPVSAKYGHGVDDVKEWILSKLPCGPAYYPKDISSEHPERFFVAEIVREKIFMQYRNEVPYACQVNVVSYKSRPNAKDFIQVEIVVEKNSQKIILIGKEGKALKLLATAARLDIEDFLQKKVFLEIEVKVKENWRQNEGLLKHYGYGGQIQII
ncbi:hypothetical protein ACJIZ3_002134 [Penstemon smallii]|uniref:GTPase Era n=1 Tax=Penstemon smallii TaxID=265156 RepID=A0ABD3U5N9_9LAMI